MFEDALRSLRPRRKGSLAASLGLHLALGAALVLPPMVRMPELAAEPPDKMTIWVKPVAAVPVSEEPVPVPRSRPRGENGGGGRGPSNLGKTYVAPPSAGAIPDLRDVPLTDSAEITGEITFEPPHDQETIGNGERQIGHPAGEGDPIVIGPDVDSPVPIFTPPPSYPDVMRMIGAQGTVVLEAVIGSDGLVRKVRVMKSLNAPLDRAAVDAVKTWRYRPALIDHVRPVAVYLTVQVSFRIQR